MVKQPSPSPTTGPLQLACPKRMALMREYARLTQELSICVEELRKLAMSADPHDCEQRWRRCERARDEAAVGMRKVYRTFERMGVCWGWGSQGVASAHSAVYFFDSFSAGGSMPWTKRSVKMRSTRVYSRSACVSRRSASKNGCQPSDPSASRKAGLSRTSAIYFFTLAVGFFRRLEACLPNPGASSVGDERDTFILDVSMGELLREVQIPGGIVRNRTRAWVVNLP